MCMFSVCLCSGICPSHDMFSSATQCINITGKTPHSLCQKLQSHWTYSEGAFCSRNFWSFTPLKYKTTDIWRSGFTVAKMDTLCVTVTVYYYWNGLSTYCLYLIKFQWYTGSFMPLLRFGLDRALLEKEGLEIRGKWDGVQRYTQILTSDYAKKINMDFG